MRFLRCWLCWSIGKKRTGNGVLNIQICSYLQMVTGWLLRFSSSPVLGSSRRVSSKICTWPLSCCVRNCMSWIQLGPTNDRNWSEKFTTVTMILSPGIHRAPRVIPVIPVIPPWMGNTLIWKISTMCKIMSKKNPLCVRWEKPQIFIGFRMLGGDY